MLLCLQETKMAEIYSSPSYNMLRGIILNVAAINVICFGSSGSASIAAQLVNF